MSDPSALFRRVRRQRAEWRHPPASPRTPAPVPAGVAPPAGTASPAGMASPAGFTTAAPPPGVPEMPAHPAGSQAAPGPVPRPAGGHALYSQLMRSHDRMGTRHLPNG